MKRLNVPGDGSKCKYIDTRHTREENARLGSGVMCHLVSIRYDILRVHAC